MSEDRKNEIQQLAIDAINGMGSRFFSTSITLNNEVEAIYAANLWYSKRDGLNVTYFTGK